MSGIQSIHSVRLSTAQKDFDNAIRDINDIGATVGKARSLVQRGDADWHSNLCRAEVFCKKVREHLGEMTETIISGWTRTAVELENFRAILRESLRRAQEAESQEAGQKASEQSSSKELAELREKYEELLVKHDFAKRRE